MSGRVPATPVVLIVINGQGVRVNGVLVLHAADVDLRQVGIRAAAERVATVHGRPVRAVLTDETMRLRLVVHPDASVSDVEVDETFEPAAGEPERPGRDSSPRFPPPFALPPQAPTVPESHRAASTSQPAPRPPMAAVVPPSTPPPSAPPAPPAPSGPARHRSSRWRRTGLVAAALVAVAGATTWTLTRGSQPAPVAPAADAPPSPAPSAPAAPEPQPAAPRLRDVRVDVTGPRPRTVRVEVSAPVSRATSVALVPSLHLRMAAPDGRVLSRVLRLSPTVAPAVALTSDRVGLTGSRVPRLSAALLLRDLDAGRYRWRLTARGLDPITGRVRVIPVPLPPTTPVTPVTPTTPVTPSYPTSPSSPSSPSTGNPGSSSGPRAPHTPSVPSGPVDPHG